MIQPNTDPHALARELSGFHFIEGALESAGNGRSFPVLDPATGLDMGHAADGDEADVNIAVASAKHAQIAWAKRSARERGKLIAECGRLLTEHVEELGRLVALESGKALRTESRVEASILADTFVYFGGWTITSISVIKGIGRIFNLINSDHISSENISKSISFWGDLKVYVKTFS